MAVINRFHCIISYRIIPPLKIGEDQLIERLSDEMRDNYLLSVKKSIVDFVLRDPRANLHEKIEKIPPHRKVREIYVWKNEN